MYFMEKVHNKSKIDKEKKERKKTKGGGLSHYVDTVYISTRLAVSYKQIYVTENVFYICNYSSHTALSVIFCFRMVVFTF